MTNYQNNMRCTRRSAPIITSPSRSCSCRTETVHPRECNGSSNDFMRDVPLAMAYVAWQSWQNLYEPCKGFQRGTIFMELDKPFTRKGGTTR